MNTKKVGGNQWLKNLRKTRVSESAQDPHSPVPRLSSAHNFLFCVTGSAPAASENSSPAPRGLEEAARRGRRRCRRTRGRKGGRGGRRLLRPRREELSTRAGVAPAAAPSASPGCARLTPAPLARPAALTAARAPQPRVLPSADTTEARGGGGAPNGFPQLGPARRSGPGPGPSLPTPASVSGGGHEDTSARSPQPHPDTARLPESTSSPHPLSLALERSRASAGRRGRRGQGGACRGGGTEEGAWRGGAKDWKGWGGRDRNSPTPISEPKGGRVERVVMPEKREA
ncbi:translation initiation factor IF-2-like [Mustela putorius furo]|uniref:Translation initiation factor IF-2-like n=1 Tax=Mustela putorius furo TaxID=9669 RepID=A0A8U0SCJ7_MUSPF|nr:translation initiation factor IF-2-like [Mustela putorius furo]